MPHVEGQAWYVEGVLQGVVGVDPVCIWMEHMKGGLGQSQVVLRQSTWSGRERGGEAGRDKKARSQ